MNLAEHGRILYVSMVDVTAPNGPGVNEREFLISLYDRLGDRIHAVLPLPRGSCDEIDSQRSTFYSNPGRWNVPGFLYQQHQLASHVRRLLATGSFDLMVVRLSIIPLAIYRIRHAPAPYAVKTLGEVQGLTRARGLKGLAAKAIAPLNLRLFHGVIEAASAVDACTETLVQRHRKDFGLTDKSIRLIENATNCERFQPRDSAEAKRSLNLNRFDQLLGFVGGAPAERGGLQMLELLARLKADYPKLGAVIVGRDNAGELRRRAKELAVEQRAVLPGVVPYAEIPAYVNAFDIGFALDRPQRMLATGNSYQKVRQYLACGKPVVSCMDDDVELVRQALVENVSPDDLNRLELAVRRLLNRSAEASQHHAATAVQFVRRQLSTKITLEQRLEFWSRRLTESPIESGCADIGPIAETIYTKNTGIQTWGKHPACRDTAPQAESPFCEYSEAFTIRETQ